MHLGQDLSVGYLSHDAEQIQLYLEESLTFIPHAAETAIRGAADDIGAAWHRGVPVLVADCGGPTRPEWLLRVVPVTGAIV